MRERKPGVWQLRSAAGVDPLTGAAVIITATHRGTKTSAQRALSELIANRRPDVAGTVEDLLDRWMAIATIGNTTRQTYQHSLAHLPKPWRSRPADKISVSDVQRLYRLLSDAGIGAQTVRKLHTVLSGAFSQGMRDELLVRNPCRGASLPPIHRSTKAPTEQQMAALFAAADEQERVWLALAITVGGRRGELVALRWPKVNMESATVTISDSLTVLNETKATKTGRTDSIPLESGTLDALRSWRSAQELRADAAGVTHRSDGYVLSDAIDSASPWRPNLATQRFAALRRRAGVSGVRLQDLRHATASYLLDSGLDIATVSQHMRHSRTSTTHDVYAHVLQGRSRRASAVLASLVARVNAEVSTGD